MSNSIECLKDKRKSDIEALMKLMMNVFRGLLPLLGLVTQAQDRPFDGIAGTLSTLHRLSNAKSFSISPENLTGEKGKGGMAVEGTASHEAADLGRGWKVNPFVIIEPSKTFTLAEINGQGAFNTSG